MGAFTGLDVGFRTEIKLPVACSLVEATLVTLAQPDDFEALGSLAELVSSLLGLVPPGPVAASGSAG
jgi:hypothetical protein